MQNWVDGVLQKCTIRHKKYAIIEIPRERIKMENIKQRKAEIRYRVMSKRSRKNPTKYYMVALLAVVIVGSLQMQGTREELVVAGVVGFIGLWAGSIAYWEDWYEKETYKRNLLIELQD
jgi:predicted histidine transporter YuiF (NhaC family)